MRSFFLTTVLCFSAIVLTVPRSSQGQEMDTVHEVVSVLGMLTNLPCNITPPYAEDQVNLVLWYKNGFGKPFFGFDLRKQDEEAANQQSKKSNHSDSSKVGFNPNSKPTAVLSLYGVTVDDAGLYKCRVDFKRSPTRYWKVNLTVIVPPNSIQLLNDRMLPISEKFISTNEFSSLILTCDVIGGIPASKAEWWLDGHPVDRSFKTVSPGKSRNTIKLESLKRKDDGKELLCVGTNNNESQPISAGIRIQLNLSPLKTTIVDPGEPLVSGETYEIVCKSYGSSPKVDIVWLTEGRLLSGFSSEIRNVGNHTESILKFIPSMKYDNTSLECQAKNPALTTVKSDKIRLTVHYSPEVELELGKSLQENNIREGDDVYFECRIKANPEVTRIMWQFEGKDLSHDKTSGILINELSLILQNVTRYSRGKYTCKAQNDVGVGSSSEIYLNVKYAPYCAGYVTDSNGQGIGVALEEKLNIKCEVDANPPPSNFIWKFNTSKDVWDVPRSNVVVDGFNSVASVLVGQDDIFQNLLCWAENELGQQNVPCLYYLLPASKPDQLENCRISNRSFTSMTVECLPGESIGLQQIFKADIYDNDVIEDGTNVSRVASLENRHFPHFSVENLKEGQNLRIVLYAVNLKGPSEERVLYGTTLHKAERHVDPGYGSDSGSGHPPSFLTQHHFLTVFLVTTVILTSLLCFILMASRNFFKNQSGVIKNHRKLQDTKKPPSDLYMFDVVDHRVDLQKDPQAHQRWLRSSHQTEIEDLEDLQLHMSQPHNWEVRSESGVMVGIHPTGKDAKCDTRSFDEDLLQLPPDQVQLMDRLLHPKQLEDFCTKLTRF